MLLSVLDGDSFIFRQKIYSFCPFEGKELVGLIFKLDLAFGFVDFVVNHLGSAADRSINVARSNDIGTSLRSHASDDFFSAIAPHHETHRVIKLVGVSFGQSGLNHVPLSLWKILNLVISSTL